MQTYFIGAFVAYFSILLLIGLFFHRKQVSAQDFNIGNRSLNFWLVAISAHASDMSAWLFMAFPMTIFLLGLPHIRIGLGLINGMFLNWHFVAPKLRTMTEKYECYTLSSFFEKRFKDQSGSIKILSAIILVIFLTHYLSAGLIAMGYLLESLFHIDYAIGLSVAMCVVIIYTFVGGFTAVAWTDLFQGVFLLCMVILVPLFAYQKIDGWNAIVQVANLKEIPLNFTSLDNFNSMITTLSLALGWGLGYFGMPHILTKFMGLQHVSEMNRSKWLGMSWQVIALTCAAIIGLIGIAYFPNGLDQPEMVFVEMVKDLFHPFLAGFILCAVVAANMSTMDSQILVCGSIISEDLYRHIFHKNLTEKKVLWVSKVSIIVISLVALLIAFNKSTTILDTVLYSWSGLGSAFGPLVLISLYSKKANRYGALAGMVVGTLVVMIWPSINSSITTYKLLPMIPGFLCSSTAIFAISKITSPNRPFQKTA